MNKINNKIKKQINETVVIALTNIEKHCSYDGINVLITGNTKRLDENGFAHTKVITPDQFLWLKLVKKVFALSLDHRNGYEGSVDKNGQVWKNNLACWGYNTEGKKVHYFVSKLLREYPGEGNWNYIF